MNMHLKRDFSRLRHDMVEKAIAGRGVRSELVLKSHARLSHARPFCRSNCVNLPMMIPHCPSKRSRQFHSLT